VKCPFSAKENTIMEACSSIKDFYLGIQIRYISCGIIPTATTLHELYTILLTMKICFKAEFQLLFTEELSDKILGDLEIVNTNIYKY
jgi:hypothetical protein